MLRMALTLFAITASVAILLAISNYFTSPIIARSAKERLDQSLNTLIPDAISFNEITDFEKEINIGSAKIKVPAIYAAKGSGDQQIGYCIWVTPMGYSDVIDMIVAIDPKGSVSGVQIISINDTPGIGMKVQSDEGFQNSVIGLNDSAKIVKSAPAAKNEIQVIAGATVSSSAYINGVNAALEVVQMLKQEV